MTAEPPSSRQITKQMHYGKVTQQNAALVEEAAIAAASLDEQAKKLKVAVEYFEIQ